MAAAPIKLEQVNGIVKTLTYVSPETGYFVAKVMVEGKGEKTVTGVTPIINVGEQLSARGTWQSSKWGPEFKAADVLLSVPTQTDGIEKYLCSAIQGIGKGYAKKMVGAFGENIFEVIEKTPEKLGEVPGIGKKRAQSIVAAYTEQRATREVMVFLFGVGLTAARANKVYQKYGARTTQQITENPYVLCQDLWGVGFSTADGVALKQGIPRDSDYRVCAGIQHVLREAEGFGSCGLPTSTVLTKASELLGLGPGIIEKCIGYEVSAYHLVRDTVSNEECLFLPKIHAVERYIAKKLLEHARAPLARVIEDIDLCLQAAQVELGILLEETQLQAVRTALTSNICVLTGGPGTGKTTITRVLLHVFAENGLTDIALCAPTGKAAKRASAATGMEAKTLHRTLEVGRDGQFKHNADNPLENDVLAIDECTMVDVRLMGAVCQAITPSTRLIMIGDVNQIPSVGPGKVLADIIAANVIPTVTLTAIFRQAATSDIIKSAHAINSGQMPAMGWREGSDFCFTEISPRNPQDENDKKRCREEIEAEVLRVTRDMYKLGYDPVRDVQVLAPMRRGLLGVESLNLKLQATLNPRPSAVLEAMGTRWGMGDKVMQIRNNYDKAVFNGDVGYVTGIDAVTRLLTVEFDTGEVDYKTSELDELTLAYALTIHKSQGSEFPVLVMPLDWSHYTMLKRNLFYTGVTRARALCVVVGQPAAAQVAVRTAQNEERYSTLRERLTQGFSTRATPLPA